MSLDAKEGRTIEYPWRKKFLEQEPLLVHEGDPCAIKSSFMHILASAFFQSERNV